MSEQEVRLQQLIDAVTDYAIYMLDPNGRVSSWNSGAERLKGYSRQEAIGLHYSQFFTEEDRAAGVPFRALDRAAREGRFESEGWRIRKDGSRFWAMAVLDAVRGEAGELIGFAKVTRDITERRAAQEALAESERQFRLLVSGVVDYALYMLDPQGIVTSWNSGAERIKGYRSDEVIGRHFSMFHTEPDRAAGMPYRSLETAREQGRYEAEGWRIRKDGTLFFASVVVDAIYDEEGELIGFAKITRDVTERRQAQAELQSAQESLARSQKMEALGQLTGGVAHDFNNLLMVVSGQAQLLRREAGDTPRAVRALDAIETAVSRAVRLTRQLLTFSRRQRLKPETVDLVKRFETLREMLASPLRGTVKLEVDLPEGLWPVLLDVGEFELALLNLAVNARDAMPSGGVLRVRAENAGLRPGQRDQNLEGDFVVLSLEDTGTGIPADILPKVFDPFFTTKQVDKGTGLGLSQVHGFVHQSGGGVGIASELGKGTRIELFLPRSPVEAATGAAAAYATEDPAPGAGRRILVVEDNPDVAAVSSTLLEQLGYGVEVVGDAAAALTMTERGGPFDLVFSDIVMAGEMDGLALARRLRESMPDLPVLLTSGYSRATEDPSIEFPILRKPYQIEELGRSVSSLIRQAQGAAEAGREPTGARAG